MGRGRWWWTGLVATAASAGAASALIAGCSGSGGNGAEAADAGAHPPVNGCCLDDCDAGGVPAQTLDASITFGSATGFRYAPACVQVPVGGTVTFSGDFNTDPLVGGTVTTVVTPSPNSPVTDKTVVCPDDTACTEALTIPFPEAGTYPFYCGIHALLGEQGAIYVVSPP